MPVLAPLVVDRTKALLSRARLDEIAEGVAGFERRLWLDEEIAATMGLNLAETLAVAEGLGVALRAKPKVTPRRTRVDHGDLTALLFAQGIAQRVVEG